MSKKKYGLVAVLFFALFLAACQPAAQAPSSGNANTPAVTMEPGAALGTALATSVDQIPETGATAVACASGMVAEEMMSAGAAVYSTTCAGCHGDQGQGSGDIPALANSKIATADDVVQMLQKVTDPSVHPFITSVTQDDLAAVLTYVRGSFGNKAAAVCPENIQLPSNP